MERHFYFIFSYLWDAECVDVTQRRNSASAVYSSWQYSGRSVAIKACATENLDTGYENGNICILANSQAENKTLDSYQINSEMASTVISP